MTWCASARFAITYVSFRQSSTMYTVLLLQRKPLRQKIPCVHIYSHWHPYSATKCKAQMMNHEHEQPFTFCYVYGDKVMTVLNHSVRTLMYLLLSSVWNMQTNRLRHHMWSVFLQINVLKLQQYKHCNTGCAQMFNGWKIFIFNAKERNYNVYT